MRKKSISLIIVLAFILSLCFSTHNIAMAQGSNTEEKVYCEIDENEDIADDTVMVVLTNSVSLSAKKYTAADFSEIGCVDLEDLTEGLWQKVINHTHTTDCNRAYETDEATFNRILQLKVKETGKSQIIADIRKLEKRDDVKSASPVYLNDSMDEVPDDTYVTSQWGIDKVSLPDAWEIEKGNSNVLVGVVDSGIDITHPDLANRVNTSLSKDFAYDYRGKYENNPFEDNIGHGTHVAGIIGAETNNSAGVAGACWNVTLVSLKITNVNPSVISFSPYVVQAIQYAAENDIHILNMSLSTTNTQYLEEAIENYKGLIVTSAGNAGLDVDDDKHYQYPTCYTSENVLTVGASTSSDELTDFSNYGKNNVDIFAPGEDIYSTIPLAFDYNDGYANMSGTSMAAPFVAGVAALLLSHYDDMDALAIKATIMKNCDEVPALSDLCVTGGRLNAYKALINPHIHDIEYSSVDDDCHIKHCECGYSKTEEHTLKFHACSYCDYSGTHAYNARYKRFTDYDHIAYCSCGVSKISGHVIDNSSYDNQTGYGICLLCKGLARAGYIESASASRLIEYLTPNGSYILPTGVIVLVEQDVIPFLNGTLTLSGNNIN